MSRILTKKYPVNPELTVERSRATFNVEELTVLIDQNEENTKERREFQQIFCDDKNAPDVLQLLNLSPTDLYDKLLWQSKYFFEKIDQLQLPNQIVGYTQYVLSIHTRYILFPFESPLVMQQLMFLPAIQSQATQEQQEKWMLSESGKVFGTYAQTELGHGSSIKDLEMTATYDPKTEEFVLNSPTMLAGKCWPGGLGRSTNYAILSAKLVVNGKNHGSHFFLVPLRNLNDHSPLPGVTVWEIGPKMGLRGTDNGYLRLDNFRIPRDNMLMKHAQVLKDGTYVQARSSKSGYSTMVWVRTALLIYCSMNLGQSCTITIRYNAIRRQGAIKAGEPETKILDYQTQQYKLFPLVALAYAYYFSVPKLLAHYMDSVEKTAQSAANEYHALISGLKALCTHLCSVGCEVNRRSCGGVGYLLASRLPDLYAAVLAACTFEGDNDVLKLQTARYLIKSFKLMQTGQEIGSSVAYLKEQKKYDRKNSSIAEYLELYEITTARMVENVAAQLNADITKGKHPDVSWRDNAVDLSRSAVFHSQLYTILCMHEFLCEKEMTRSLHAVMKDLYELLCLHWIDQSSGEFLLFGGVSADVITNYRARIPILLEALRPNIVALVDAFDFHDLSLQSVIGCYDGRVYERLYEYWESLPANKSQGKFSSSELIKSNL